MLCCIAMLLYHLMGCRKKRFFCCSILKSFSWRWALVYWIHLFIAEYCIKLRVEKACSCSRREWFTAAICLLTGNIVLKLLFFLYAKCFNYFWIILLLKSWRNLITVCHCYERNVVCQASSEHLNFEAKILFIHYFQPQAVWGGIAKWFST